MNRSQYQLPSTVLHPNQPTRPFLPSLSANPFRELRNLFCRLPLPTFLHNTIGCSPWRPEAVCSTVMESQLESIAFSRTFCSRIKTEKHKDSSMQGKQGYLPVIRFQPQIHHIQNEKITHRFGTKDVCWITDLSVTTLDSYPWWWNENHLAFRGLLTREVNLYSAYYAPP
jgi:hypothetical protein